jgi:hypothetical protein
MLISRKRRLFHLISQVKEEVHDGSRLKKLINNALKNNTLKRVIVDRWSST